MEIREIEERITKKQAQIAKIQRRITKWENAKSDAAFKKEYRWLADENGLYRDQNGNFTRSYDEFKKARYAEYVKNCNREISYAACDLTEAETQLEKYKNALIMAQAKQNKLNAPRIKVIMEFLEGWKAKVEQYIVNNAKVATEYYEASRAASEFYNTQWRVYTSRREFRQDYDELYKKAEDIKARVDSLTFEVYEFTGDHVNHDKLKAYLDKEADNLYLDMVERVTKVIGEINDAAGLSIGAKGELNGVISGAKGKARIETIGAGGYNIQRYHFRTLVHPIKN